MKKAYHQVIIIVSMLFLMFLFAACGNQYEYLIIEDSDTHPVIENQLTIETYLPIINYSIVEAPPQNLTLEDFLYDFDYMTQLMEDTFPYFGVAERRLGIDIRALAQEARIMIENYPYSMQERASEFGIALEDMPILDEHVFWSIIFHEFFTHFSPFAHTNILRFNTYNRIRPMYERHFVPFDTPNNLHAFTNEISEAFYREQETLFRTLPEKNLSLFQFIFRMYMDEPLPILSTVITTESIEDGKIAYLGIPSFSGSPQLILERFYRSIEEYNHLIIDIRDNPGGSVDMWRMLIMYLLWQDRDNMPNMPLRVFYNDSDLARSLAEFHIQNAMQFSRHLPETDYLLTTSEMMQKYYLPYLNEDDLQGFAYGISFNTSIANIEMQHIRRAGMAGAFSPIPFNGKIWILSNERNTSAAALFVRHAKYMNFATIVGEQTHGLYTSSYGTYFALPNTGVIVRWDIDYVTDEFGRSLEEFPTMPNYFNREGMDALETVLHMIKEGNY